MIEYEVIEIIEFGPRFQIYSVRIIILTKQKGNHIIIFIYANKIDEVEHLNDNKNV